MNLSAFLGIAQQIEAEVAGKKPVVTAAPVPEQASAAEDKTETKATVPAKEVKYVKSRPTEVDPEKLHNLPTVPSSIEALVRESAELKQRKADLQADVQVLLDNAKAPAIDKRLAEIPILVAEELKKFPEKAVLIEDLIMTTFSRVTAFEGNLTKEQEKMVTSLTARIKTANASIARCKEKITRLNEEAFAKRGGKQSVAEHVQVFPDPEKRVGRGEASRIFTEPIKPKAPSTAVPPAEAKTAAGMLEQANVLHGIELNAFQRERLNRIEAGILEMFRSALASVKDIVKSLVGIDKDVDSLMESLKAEPVSAA